MLICGVNEKKLMVNNYWLIYYDLIVNNDIILTCKLISALVIVNTEVNTYYE